MRKAYLILLLLTSILSLKGQTVVNTLFELQPYLSQDNANIKLTPGDYFVTGEDCENGVFGTDIEIGNPEKAIFAFSGNNSTYDFTGVTIYFETKIFQTFGGGYDIAEIHVIGNFNVLKNLTMVDNGSVYDKPDKGGNGIVMDGEGNLIQGFHQTTKGSFPYGYGDVFGKGGSYTIKHYKHCSTLIRGQSNQFKNNTIIHRSYGHALYMQAAFDPVIDGCYIEGEMRSTDDMLLEQGTGSPADLIDFQTDFGFKLLPGWMKATGEEGIRAYNGGTTVVNGDTITGAASNPTVVNCTVKNMRGGVTLAHADGTAYVENCRTIGCQGGYSIKKGSVVNCYSDAAYGQILKYAYNNYSNTNIEITVIPPEDGYYHNGPKCLAYIGGNNHNIVLRNADPNPNPDLNIQLGGHIDFLSFQEGNEISSQNNHTPSGVTLENYTGYNIIIADGSDNNNIQTCGTWNDNGADNSITTFTDCIPTTTCLPVRDPFEKIEAESFCETLGASITGDGTSIGSLYNGDWVMYSSAVFGSDISNGIELIVGKDNADVTFIDVYLDSLNTTPIASVEVPNTGGWYTWETISVAFPEINDLHDVYLGFRNDASASAVTNIESFRFLQNNLCGLVNHYGLSPIEAEDFCEMYGVSVQENVPGSWVVNQIEDGDYIAYGNVDFGVENTNNIVVRASSQTNGGTIEVRDGSPTGTLITSVDINNTGGLDNYVEFSPEFPFSLTGEHDIYLVFKGEVGVLFNLDVFEFEYNLCKETLFDGLSTIQAEDFCEMYGMGTETISGDNMAINAIQNNDYVVFGNVDFGNASVSELTVRTASQTTGGTLEVRSGSIFGELITTIQIEGTGNWKTYNDYSSTVPFSLTGKHDLCFVFKVESGYICNMDEFTFTGVDFCNSTTKHFEAECFDDLSGIADEGENIGSIRNGYWAKYSSLNLSEMNSVNVSASSAGLGGIVEFRLDAVDGSLLGTVDIHVTGNWNTWETFSANIEKVEGTHDIYAVFTGPDGWLYNIDFFGFSEEEIVVTDLESTINLDPIKIYPNPAKNLIHIDDATNSIYELFDNNGIIYQSGVVDSNSGNVNIEELARGIYFLKVFNNGSIIVEKVILE